MYIYSSDMGNIAKVSGRAGFIQGADRKSYVAVGRMVGEALGKIGGVDYAWLWKPCYDL